MLRRLLLLLCISSIGVLSAYAQDVTPTASTTIAPINFGQPVEDTLTDELFFDWWRITLSPNDVIEVQMQGYDGLEPLIGILDAGRELVARSDTNGVADPNGLAGLQYRVETAGEYTIVATRNGNSEGTSTGRYELVVFPANNIPDRPNDRIEVEFRCKENLITTALVVQFSDEVPPPNPNAPSDGSQLYEWYRITVFGLDDFQPFIRARASIRNEPLDCSHYADSVYNSSYTLPNQPAVTVTEADAAQVSQLTLRNASPTDRFGAVEINIGSLNGGRGRYLVVIEGLALQEANDLDQLGLRPGPLAGGAPLTIYSVGNPNSRLDPAFSVYTADGTALVNCDDAGRKGCENIAPFTGAGVNLLVDPATQIVGDRFDAGAWITPASEDILTLQVESRGQATFGGYTLFFIGELPPPDLSVTPTAPAATPTGAGN